MLYIISTPIGNLGDITLRAIETLKKCHFILAEDTRVTAKLLQKYDVKAQMVSYRDQNHEILIKKVLEKLGAGLDLALVSDAGTPTISDPGYKLVTEVRNNGYEVISIPGASACISALSISGLPTDRFVFLGFLPKSESRRIEILSKFMGEKLSIIIYESPKRLLKLLEEVVRIDSERKVFVANDLTKMFEKNRLGRASELQEIYKVDKLKGEFVVVVGPANL